MFANRICKNKTLDLGDNVKLKRDEALSFLNKEVLSESPYMSPDAVTLKQLKNSDNYAVNIKEKFSAETIKDLPASTIFW